MQSFELTAQIVLQPPKNTKAVADSISRTLQTINVPVNVQISPKATKNLQQTSTALKGVTTQANAAAKAQTAVATSAAKTGTAMTKSTGAIKQADSALESYGKSAGLALRRNSAFLISTTIVFGFGRAMITATKDAIDFQRELVKVAQVTQTSIASLRGLENTIRGLASEFGVASEELLNVSRLFAQTGLSANKVRIALRAVAKTSLAATFDDMASTAEGAIAIMNQFNIPVSDLESVFDSMNAVAGRFPVEVADMTTAVKKAGAAFAAASNETQPALKTFNEFLATFTSIRATTRAAPSLIATGLKNVFARLQRPQNLALLEQVGIEVRDVEGKFIGAFEAINNVSKALNEIRPRDPRFFKIVEAIGGLRNVDKVIPLLTQLERRTDAYAVASDSAGSVTRDTEKALENLSVQIKQVREDWKNFIASLVRSSTFQTTIKLVLDLTKALIGFADTFKSVLPLLLGLGVVKGFRALGVLKGFGRGFGGTAPQKLAGGGKIPGVGNTDSVAALLTPGEFVIPKSVASRLPLEVLSALQTGKLVTANAGGLVTPTRGNYGIRDRGRRFLIDEEQASRRAPSVQPIPPSSSRRGSSFLAAEIKAEQAARRLSSTVASSAPLTAAERSGLGSAFGQGAVQAQRTLTQIQQDLTKDLKKMGLSSRQSDIALKKFKTDITKSGKTVTQAMQNVAKRSQRVIALSGRQRSIGAGISRRVGGAINRVGANPLLLGLVAAPLAQQTIGGVSGGVVAGAATGAALGSFAGPAGTVIGAGLGGLAGGLSVAKQNKIDTARTRADTLRIDTLKKLDRSFTEFDKTGSVRGLEQSFSRIIEVTREQFKTKGKPGEDLRQTIFNLTSAESDEFGANIGDLTDAANAIIQSRLRQGETPEQIFRGIRGTRLAAASAFEQADPNQQRQIAKAFINLSTTLPSVGSGLDRETKFNLKQFGIKTFLASFDPSILDRATKGNQAVLDSETKLAEFRENQTGIEQLILQFERLGAASSQINIAGAQSRLDAQRIASGSLNIAGTTARRNVFENVLGETPQALEGAINNLVRFTGGNTGVRQAGQAVLIGKELERTLPKIFAEVAQGAGGGTPQQALINRILGTKDTPGLGLGARGEVGARIEKQLLDLIALPFKGREPGDAIEIAKNLTTDKILTDLGKNSAFNLSKLNSEFIEFSNNSEKGFDRVATATIDLQKLQLDLRQSRGERGLQLRRIRGEELTPAELFAPTLGRLQGLTGLPGQQAADANLIRKQLEVLRGQAEQLRTEKQRGEARGFLPGRSAEVLNNLLNENTIEQSKNTEALKLSTNLTKRLADIQSRLTQLQSRRANAIQGVLGVFGASPEQRRQENLGAVLETQRRASVVAREQLPGLQDEEFGLRSELGLIARGEGRFDRQKILNSLKENLKQQEQANRASQFQIPLGQLDTLQAGQRRLAQLERQTPERQREIQRFTAAQALRQQGFSPEQIERLTGKTDEAKGLETDFQKIGLASQKVMIELKDSNLRLLKQREAENIRRGAEAAQNLPPVTDLNKMSTALDNLAKKIPPEGIKLVGTHTVNVIINGAELFARMDEPVRDLVINEINKGISKLTDAPPEFVV